MVFDQVKREDFTQDATFKRLLKTHRVRNLPRTENYELTCFVFKFPNKPVNPLFEVVFSSLRERIPHGQILISAVRNQKHADGMAVNKRSQVVWNSNTL